TRHREVRLRARLARGLHHLQLDLREGLARADVAHDDRRRRVEVVLPVHLAGVGLADRRAAALGPAALRLHLPVPALDLDPLLLALLDRLAVGLVEEAEERVDCHDSLSCCDELPARALVNRRTSPTGVSKPDARRR